MSNLVKLLQAVVNDRWAIKHETLDAILSIVQRSNEEVPFSAFHGTQDRSAFVGVTGDRVQGTRFTSIYGNTGVLTIDGPLLPRAGVMRGMSTPELVSYERISAEFVTLESDPSIKNILLVLDSPGGSVTGLSELATLISSSKKNTQSYVMGNAASAAYWVASATKQIFAANTSEVGSIGTVITLTDRKKADEANGIKTIELVSSVSPYKRRDYSTEEGVASLQKIADQLGDLFVDAVAKNRSVSRDKVLKDFGQGDMLVAAEAKAAGMIDEITTLSEVLKQNNLKGKTNTGVRMTVKTGADSTEQQISAKEFASANPEAYASIVAEACAKERERIMSIEAIDHPGARELVAAAKADPNGSAASVKAAFADLVLSGKVAIATKQETSASDTADAIAKSARELTKTSAGIPDGQGIVADKKEKERELLRKAAIEAANANS